MYRLWKYFGIAFAWSAGAFLLCLAVSRMRGGYLSHYVLDALIPDIQAGYYSGLLYWLSLWLSFTAALISAFGVLQAYSRQAAAAQAPEIKNNLVTESYRALRERIESDSRTRHELKHRLTVLDCLCQNQDLTGIRKALDEMLLEQAAAPPDNLYRKPARQRHPSGRRHPCGSLFHPDGKRGGHSR